MTEQDPNAPSITQIYRDRSVTFDSLVAEDAEMKRVLAQAEKAARSDASVLILGETGTGKNLVAQAIHNASRRQGQAFVACNCAAFSESLLESELFGHEKGAFTGAEKQRRGVFELADGGTLFLDEIGELSKNAQAKILRAVEYKEFERVGGEETLKADLRIVFATHRDLREAVRDDAFREDLYYRVHEFELSIPPLRKRPGDVRKLAERFLAEGRAAYGYPVQGFTDDAMRALLDFDWPGNVRRLRSAVRRAAAIADGELIGVEDLELSSVTTPSKPAPTEEVHLEEWSLHIVERRHIEKVLAHTKGNKSEASRILGVARTTLDRKIATYGIDA